MALRTAALAPGALKQVALPDPVSRFKTLADVRGTLQNEQLRSQQIQQNDAELQAQQQAMQKAAAVHDILASSGGEVTPEVLNSIFAVDQNFGMALKKDFEATRQKTATDARAEAIKNAELIKDQPGIEMEVGKAPLYPAALPELGHPNVLEKGTPAPIVPAGSRVVGTPYSAPVEIPSATGGPGVFTRIRTRFGAKQEADLAAQQKQEMELEQIRERERAQKEFSTTAPPKATLEEKAMADWLAKNPGKGPDDYQNMDANRRRQVVNVNLETLRALEIDNKTNASPGQVVFKSSGKPVGKDLPETAATRLEGLQTAIQQADIVEQALLKLGNTGAVKGYIEENGVYWPVVQDQLTPEQAEAVSETNRLLSAYAQAVSGLAVSDNEIARLKKSAPSVRLTPEANKKIVGHFKRNAMAKRDNYLDIRGWKLKEGEAPAGGGGGSLIVPGGALEKLLGGK